MSVVFSVTAELFALEFGMVFQNDVGKTANNFGAHWIHDAELWHN